MSSLNMVILKLLTEGKKSTQSLCAATGKTSKQVGSALSWLAARGFVLSEPVSYGLTETGSQRAAWKPKTPKKTLARQKKYATKVAERVKVDKRQKCLVQSAISKQPPLMAIWGK